MTNHLVGDVYQKIIEEVMGSSAIDFEESGVGQGTLNDLQKEWQHKLSQRQVAQMPWDPKPTAVAHAPNPSAGLPSGPANGPPPAPYGAYENGAPNGATRIKTEAGIEQQYHGLPQMNGYAPQQGGAARAQQLVQDRFGAHAAASLSMPRGGLALPGQHQKPQGLQLPNQSRSQQQLQQQYSQQQQQQAIRQQQQVQQQQQNPRIKVENDSPRLTQAQYQQQQRPSNPQYGQTDGADDGLDEWQTMLSHRRAQAAEQTQQADRMMRGHIASLSETLESGLMLSLDKQQSRLQSRKRKAAGSRQSAVVASSSSSLTACADSSIPQMDGEADDNDTKDNIKDEGDDEDAINSDLDDPEDDQNQIGDEDDDLGDSILCTYDKVQRVKNKWKCTLKDGVLNTGGKEYLFHKAQGEFEW